MRLSKEQSESLMESFKASGIKLAHIARKYNLDYASLRKWMRGEAAASKHNRYRVYEAAMLSELGWRKQ